MQVVLRSTYLLAVTIVSSAVSTTSQSTTPCGAVMRARTAGEHSSIHRVPRLFLCRVGGHHKTHHLCLTEVSAGMPPPPRPRSGCRLRIAGAFSTMPGSTVDTRSCVMWKNFTHFLHEGGLGSRGRVAQQNASIGKPAQEQQQ